MAEQIKLSQKYQLGGKEVDTVELREPLVKDMELISQDEENPIKSQNQLIRILSGLDSATDEEFGLMKYKDYIRIQNVLEGLTS